jgi:hypothetical protein
MSKIKRLTKDDGGYHGELTFWCEGCKEFHHINDSKTEIANANVWEFNGDFEHPTINPSILITSRKFNQKTNQYENIRCHSFIKNGEIQYLHDCTHSLKGTTIVLDDTSKH